MDPGARARQHLLAGALLALGCAPAPLVRAARPAPPPAQHEAPRAPAPRRFPIDADFARSLVALAPEALSRGHAVGRYRLRIYGNAVAARAWRERSERFPRGAVLVAAHVEVAGGAPGPVLVMQKRAPGYFAAGADWEYAYADATPRPLRQGRLDDCASCHTLADNDAVFVSGTAR